MQLILKLFLPTATISNSSNGVDYVISSLCVFLLLLLQVEEHYNNQNHS